MVNFGLNKLQKALLDEVCSSCYARYEYVENFFHAYYKIVVWHENGRFVWYTIPIVGRDEDGNCILENKNLVIFIMSSARYYKGFLLPKILELAGDHDV